MNKPTEDGLEVWLATGRDQAQVKRSLVNDKFTARTGIGNTPSVSLLKSLGFELIGTESVSFYKDSQGNDIVFEGGIFELNTIQ